MAGPAQLSSDDETHATARESQPDLRAPGVWHRSAAWCWLSLALWVAGLDAWFQGPLLGGRAPTTAAFALIPSALAAALLYRREARASRAAADHVHLALTALVLVVSTLVRLPALSAPGSLISSDSAVGGIVAQDLRAGERPAPIYAPGFPYEGTLKPHLTALLGALMPEVSTPFLYTLASHVFQLLWTVAVMGLARAAGGRVAALGAGLFMAVSPRFLTAFSLNNVGQYPEVNALGAWSLLLAARGPGLLLSGFTLGLALWQQLLGVYFLLTLFVAVALTPKLRRFPEIVQGLIGLACGSYPIWIWNAANAWSSFDLFRRGGKHPADRLTGLPERLETMLTVSFPKLFGLSDLGVVGLAATLAASVLPLLVLWVAWARRAEFRQGLGGSSLGMVLLLFAVVVLVFNVSKFSHRGAQRPRYLMPLYTPVAVASGVGLALLWRRSRPAAAAAALAVLGANAFGLAPWLRSRADAEARDEAFIQALVAEGIKNGYAGFWVSAKYTFLADGRFVLAGDLGPDASWVHLPHSARVREAGADAFVLESEDLAAAFARRLDSLGCRFRRTEVSGYVVFHHLSRPVSLEEVSGYDADASGRATPPSDLE